MTNQLRTTPFTPVMTIISIKGMRSSGSGRMAQDNSIQEDITNQNSNQFNS